MIYAYTRVSTDMQTVDNQRYGIKEYCKTRGMAVNAWYNDEGISGTVMARDRELGHLLNLITDGDTIITTEISRIGRSVVDVLQTIKIIREKGCTLIAIKQGFILDDSLNSKIMTMVFAMVSEIERELISQRVKEGLASRKAKGIKLGRPYGSKNKKSKLAASKDYIEMCLQTGKSRYFLKKHLCCHSHTLNEYLKSSGLAKKYNINL